MRLEGNEQGVSEVGDEVDRGQSGEANLVGHVGHGQDMNFTKQYKYNMGSPLTRRFREKKSHDLNNISKGLLWWLCGEYSVGKHR